MFGFIFLNFLQFNESDEVDVRLDMLKAIEARWSRADQDAFIATVILNPFYKTSLFKQADVFTVAGIYTLLKRLWTRFYNEEPPITPISLWKNLTDYLDETGPYQNMKIVLEDIRSEASREVWSQIPTYNYIILILPSYY